MSSETVCKTCNDSHVMVMRSWNSEQSVPCTKCPLPCSRCRDNLGAYCAVSACTCDCHKKIKVLNVDITLSYSTNDSRVHYRVLGTKGDDVSGWAESEGDAIYYALKNKNEILSGWK